MDRLWQETQERLAQRDHPKWESMSWLALRPLIDAINDRVNTLCPQLVPDLRDAWLRQGGDDPARGYTGVVDRSGTSSFILMGDTGEQDASQYVVGTALREVMFAADGSMRHDFALICSDVIYPSGDVNDYVHGFYLPYETLLHQPADTGGPQPQRIYALPGNHDWYDGLDGFMHAFCGRTELDPTNYGWPDHPVPEKSRWRRVLRIEEVGRLLWRRPSPPLAAKLHRDDAAARPLAELHAERMPAPSPGTAQPGPYYAIQLNGLLVVCIDAGIGSRGNSWIDAEQGRWLVEVSRRPGPKILLTGYPLLDNAEWKQCLISGDVDGRPWDGPPTVNAVLVDPANRYVASLGGDIHNFEHYDLRVGHDAHPMTYVVSGGGGAYISATHPIASAARVHEDRVGDAEAIRAANEARGGPPTDDDVRAGMDAAARAPEGQRHLGPLPNLEDVPLRGGHGVQLPMIPTAAASMVHFTEQVLPKTWRLLRAMLCFGGGGLLVLPFWRHADLADGLLVACLAVFAGAVVVRSLIPTPLLSLRTASRGRIHAYRAAVALSCALAGAVAVLGARWSGPGPGPRYLGCWAVITAVSGCFGSLQRRSGWWREPSPEPGGDHAASSALWGALVLVAGGVALYLLFDRTGAVPVAAAALLLVVVAGIGWRVRARRRWRQVSQTVALAVQLVAGALVLGAVPDADAGWRPLAVLLGVALDLVLVLVALVISVLLAVLTARVRSLRRPELGGWRRAIGLARYVVPTVAALVLAGLAGLAAWDALPRAAIVTGWGLALLVVLVFTVDLLRRRRPGSYRWIATPMVVAVLGVAGWGAGQGWWLGGGLVVAAIGSLLGVITVITGYLAFLGGQHLVFDLPAHRDRLDRPGRTPLLSHDEAEAAVRWRRTGVGTRTMATRARNRARFVFPSTDQPQGLIQQKVSEFFSSDSPPFFQNVLTMQLAGASATGGPDRLEITPLLITGLEPATVARPTIVVPLDGAPAWVRPLP